MVSRVAGTEHVLAPLWYAMTASGTDDAGCPTASGSPRLHHVAIVVGDLDEAVARYERLGFTGGERFLLPEQAVEVVTFHSGDGWIELIAPTDPEGPIARYLAKRGEGLHHVAYAVLDLEVELRELEARGVRLIDASPRTGAHGWRIAFVHPESCGGVLTELVEDAS